MDKQMVIFLSTTALLSCTPSRTTNQAPATVPKVEKPSPHPDPRSEKQVPLEELAPVQLKVADEPEEFEVPTEEPLDAVASTGRLCIKGPGSHNLVGKGNSGHQDLTKWKNRAKKVNRGMLFKVDEKEVSAKGKTGAMIEGLDPLQKYRVGIRFVGGGSSGGFRLVFPKGETDVCAYYNGFYDNWRLRPVGRKGCGPCEPN